MKARSRLATYKNRKANGQFKKTDYFNKTWFDFTSRLCLVIFLLSLCIPSALEERIAKADDSPVGVVQNDVQLADSLIATTSATPTPALELSDKQEVMNYIIEVFGDDADRAIWIAKCESGLRKNALNDKNGNGTTDHGIFQINSVHIARRGDAFTYDWKANVHTAKKIFDEQGFKPWVCAKSIGEKNYLNN